MLKPDEVQALLAMVNRGETLDKATLIEVLSVAHVGAVRSLRGTEDEPNELFLELADLREKMDLRERDFLAKLPAHGWNMTRAARAAGFPDRSYGSLKEQASRTGKRLRRAIEIMQRLEEIDSGNYRLTALKTLDEVRARSMQAKPALDSEGRAIGIFEADHAVAVQASKELIRATDTDPESAQAAWLAALMHDLKRVMDKKTYEEVLEALRQIHLVEEVAEGGAAGERSADDAGPSGAVH